MLCSQSSDYYPPSDCNYLADIESFQACACSAFTATLTTAQDVQKEFSFLLVHMNNAMKSSSPGMNREKLLQRLIIEATVPYAGLRLFHISLGQQFSRIFLKRRKVQ